MMVWKNLLVVVLVWILALPVCGQEGRVDSLEQLLANGEVSETRRAEVLLEMSEVYKQSNPQLGREKAERALQLLDKEGSPEAYAKTLNALGGLSVKLGDIQAARNYYDEAYRTAFSYPVSSDQKVDAIKGRGTVASYSGDSDSALELYNEGLSICDSLGLLAQKADLLTNKSIVLQNQRKYEEALTLQKATWRLKKQLGVSKLELGKTLLGIANTFARMSQNDSASVYANQALSSFRDSGDQYGIALSFSAKGNIARGLGKLEEAVSYFDSARTYHQRIGNEQQVAISGMQAGSVMNVMQLSDKAAKYLKASLAILEKGQNKPALLFAYQSYANALSGSIDGEEGLSARETRDTIIQINLKAAAIAKELGDHYSEGLALSNLGLNYYLIEEYNKAIAVLRKGIKLRNDEGLYHPYLTLGNCYVETKRPKQARQALLTSDSLASQIEGLTSTAEYYKELAVAYEKLGMYAESSKALFRYIEIRNQYYDESKASAIAEIEERYQTERKELEIEALQREKELQAKVNRNQRLGLGGLGLGIVALAGLSISLYRQRQRIQAQKTEIELLHREQRHRMMNNLVFANSLMGLQVRRLA
ncbi:MAG TPA: tetratricopeptide repeat protein, partial [Phaeodactylibacter sp.]|nr:tetratricopeptide repeat protein [Phaeodactylibacter sp.]